jgi:hypothetical protein
VFALGEAVDQKIGKWHVQPVLPGVHCVAPALHGTPLQQSASVAQL